MVGILKVHLQDINSFGLYVRKEEELKQSEKQSMVEKNEPKTNYERQLTETNKEVSCV